MRSSYDQPEERSAIAAAHTLDNEVFEANLIEVRRRAAGPVEGLFGPKSQLWETLREVAVLGGGGRALLLQLAHPAVAAGVDQHSSFRVDPLGRAYRTFSMMYQISFGDLESAILSARRIHALHAKVRGPLAEQAEHARYRANDPALLFWVMATLIDSALQLYEVVIRPLSKEERHRGYEEAKLIGLVMGIPLDKMPATRADFDVYFDQMINGSALTLGETGKALCQAVFRSTFGLDKVLTVGLLPERLRRALFLQYNDADRRAHERLLRTLRALFSRMPPALRYVPAWHQGMARIAAAQGTRVRVSTQMITRLARVVKLPLAIT